MFCFKIYIHGILTYIYELHIYICWEAQLCLTLHNTLDCSLPGSSVHEIFQQEYWTGYHFHFQGIFPTHGLSWKLLCLLHCRQIICWAIREAVCVCACVCVCVCVCVYNYSFYMIFYCCCCSVAQSCLTFWNSMGCSTSGFPVLHHFSELVQTHVHWVNDANQPSHPLSPVLLLPSILPGIRVFSHELALHTRWPKYWSFSFRISPSNEYSGLISFRIDWFDPLAVQGTLKSLLQHRSLKASILQCSAFFMVQLSHPYMTTGKK